MKCTVDILGLKDEVSKERSGCKVDSTHQIYPFRSDACPQLILRYLGGADCDEGCRVSGQGRSSELMRSLNYPNFQKLPKAFGEVSAFSLVRSGRHRIDLPLLRITSVPALKRSLQVYFKKVVAPRPEPFKLSRNCSQVEKCCLI
jgi:hypothetical protein